MTPRPRLVLLLLALLPLALLGGIRPDFLPVLWAANFLVLAVAILDRRLTPRAGLIEMSRDAPAVMSLGSPNLVTLRCRSRARTPLAVEVHDEPPPNGDTRGIPVLLTLEPGRERTVRYAFHPRRRGEVPFGAMHLRYPSRLGLWTVHDRREAAWQARIYPDVRAVRRYDELARSARLADIGLHASRIRGRGREFERLREYRRGDELRAIDWKATARAERLISREFVSERDQRIIVLLDCGQSMRNESDGISLLDLAINASLILGYVALSGGDRVSLLAFSDRIERRTPLLRGRAGVQELARQTFDLEARPLASDYNLALEEAGRRFSKRSLVVLVSHSLDEHHLQALAREVRIRGRRHLHLVALIRDPALRALADRPPETEREAYSAAAAAELLVSEARVLAELRREGAIVLEVSPEELTPALVNRYLDLKSRQVL